MIKSDPIIAVQDVVLSSKWYQTIFNCKSNHGGEQFDILVDENNSVILCLHKWGNDDHPSMIDTKIPAGNGLILYFRVKYLNKIIENISSVEWPVEEEIHINPNTQKQELAILDPDGYYLIITEYHNYEG